MAGDRRARRVARHKGKFRSQTEWRLDHRALQAPSWKEPVEFMHHCSTKWGVFLLSLKSLLETGKGAAWPHEISSTAGNKRQRQWRETMQEALVVRRETHISAPPAAVFALLTDPELILRWMGTEAQFEPLPGGLYLVNITGALWPAAPSARWSRCTAWPTASAMTAAKWCLRDRAWSR
jgi:hypothetical protein